MQRQTRNLFTALLGAGALTLLGSTSSFALDIPTPLKYDMGPLGTWKLNGGVSGFVAGWNANTPGGGGTAGDNNGAATIRPGASQLNGDASIDNAIFILNSTNFGFLPLQFHVWAGIPPNTPVLGYTSPNLGPNLHALQGSGSQNAFGHGSPLFKGWATYQPLDWLSIEGGRLPSPDGTEIGVDFLNPSPFLSDLNNMQTTTADGGQINFISGPDKAFYWGFLPGYGSTLTVRIADGYKTGHANELGFTGLWNLNPDGSDFLVGFGHTRLDTAGSVAGGASTGTGHVAGYGTVNADLIGLGWNINIPHILGWNTNGFSVIGQAERQWLPKSAIPSSVRLSKGGQDYYNWAIENNFVYDWGLRQIFGQPIRMTTDVNPQFIYQHGDSADPNDNQLGNFLGLNTSATGTRSDLSAGSGGDLGTFGAGSKMFSLEVNQDFQFHNFFIRPSIAYTHLSSVDPGFGYGTRGQLHSQVVTLLEFGFLLGQPENTDTGQH